MEMSVGFESSSNELVVASGIEVYRAITFHPVACELCILQCDVFRTIVEIYVFVGFKFLFTLFRFSVTTVGNQRVRDLTPPTPLPAS